MSEMIFFTLGETKDLLRRLHLSAFSLSCVLLSLFKNKPVVLIEIFFFRLKFQVFFFFIRIQTRSFPSELRNSLARSVVQQLFEHGEVKHHPRAEPV